MITNKLLIVDDEIDLLSGLKRLVTSKLGCKVYIASSAKTALEILKEKRCQLVLSDIRMPDMDGMKLLETITGDYPQADVILMTAYGTIDQAVDALQKGACDFVTKPLQHKHLFHILSKCFERRQLIEKNLELQRAVKKHQLTRQFIGSSPALQKALSIMERVADSAVTVLITGESGTGKELAARTIHRLSGRNKKEMIAVNCAAIPEAVLESELFGHKKGAFTGADKDHPGLFAAAEGSTLFLDEIGEIPLAVQAKLLRVLQEREIRAIGDTATRKIDVRVLASTNCNLQVGVQEGTFRKDLYFRINEITLPMPPLRMMIDDIPLLSQKLVEQFCAELNRPQKMLSPDAMRVVCGASWPGNVRQLQNVLKRAILLGREDVIDPDDLDLGDGHSLCSDSDIENLIAMDYRSAKIEILRKFSTVYLSKLMSATAGNVSKAARECGLERQSLQHLLNKYGISAQSFRN